MHLTTKTLRALALKQTCLRVANSLALASQQAGFLGVESTCCADRFGITVSYWESKEAIQEWKANAEHSAAQESGKRQWYTHYE